MMPLKSTQEQESRLDMFIQIFSVSTNKHVHCLPPEILQLQRPQTQISHRTESKPKLKSNITTIRNSTSVYRNRSNEPHLAHARHHARDTKAERGDSCDTWWELLGGLVVFWSVAAEAAFEDEVVGQGDTFVCSKCISIIVK
jgi:hypothetical protein